ncbi:unnamed protein product [Caenorhabditis angaria]|uniref:Seven TM Receptor n=1 Tax=Caenorhabditis angaria TaxID=860376 RepID=A0A9P1IY27_9PELO|nr:unnamed protein product [Caenorhabditis angaria]
MGPYKYLLCSVSIFEMCYSFLDILISPIIFSHGSIYMNIVHTKNHFLSPQILLVLNAVYCGFFGSFMAVFSINFIYRYYVAAGSKLLQTFKGYRLCVWALLPLSYGTCWGLVCYFLIGPNEKIDMIMGKEVMMEFGWPMTEINYIGPYCYQFQEDGSYEIDINSLIALASMVSMIISSVAVTFYYGFKCYLRITKLMSNSSRNMKSLQSQLFYALVTQTLIPVFLMHIPSLDPFPTMFIIKQYRQGVLDYSGGKIFSILRRTKPPSNVELNMRTRI